MPNAAHNVQWAGLRTLQRPNSTEQDMSKHHGAGAVSPTQPTPKPVLTTTKMMAVREVAKMTNHTTTVLLLQT